MTTKKKTEDAPQKRDPLLAATARYERRQKERGFKLLRVWVPADRVDDVKEFAADLRVEHKAGK